MALPDRPVDGGSRPRFYDFDDGVTRLVKWHPSVHLYEKGCYNELIASRLGRLIGAPLQRGMVVHVGDDVIPSDQRADGAVAGFHFATMRMPGRNFRPAPHYAGIRNGSELPAAAVLLAWLAVGDSERNIFLHHKIVTNRLGAQRRSNRFTLIDMGMAFGTHHWTAADIAVPHTSYELPRHMLPHLTRANLAPAIARLKALGTHDIAACIADRPDEWAISTAEVAALEQRLIAGRDAIESILYSGNPTIPRQPASHTTLGA
ncbi:MAG TPA: hypothetical protein VGT98_03000 [Candidatus Elarobacter sp.]|nr:hypothetical protein [Candidatus Elarobacter sp.]HEV2739203.1 hypothetical protein [Candidatus Elarobacter sp.]